MFVVQLLRHITSAGWSQCCMFSHGWDALVLPPHYSSYFLLLEYYLHVGR